MSLSRVSKIISEVKKVRGILKPNGSALKVEYFVFLDGKSKTLIVEVDIKAAYLTFDGTRVSRPNLQKILDQAASERKAIIGK